MSGPKCGDFGRTSVDLDAFDAKILEEIQRDARATADALAEVVGLSAAACQKRLRRLRGAGYVSADIAILHPALADARLTLILHVTLKGEATLDLAEFSQRMRAADQVMQCYRVTGDAHFVVMITADSMSEYEAFCGRHIYGPGNVERLTTVIVKERVKTGFFQPIKSTGGHLRGGRAPSPGSPRALRRP